jgi:hypothetical protein
MQADGMWYANSVYSVCKAAKIKIRFTAKINYKCVELVIALLLKTTGLL